MINPEVEGEQDCARDLRSAKINENHHIEALKFYQMGDIYTGYSADKKNNLSERQYHLVKATVLYNCALNIIQEKKLGSEIDPESIRTQLSFVEGSLMAMLGITTNPFPFAQFNSTHKETLYNIRGVHHRKL